VRGVCQGLVKGNEREKERERKRKKAKKKNKRECKLLRFYDNKGLIVTNIKMLKYPPERVENLIP